MIIKSEGYHDSNDESNGNGDDNGREKQKHNMMVWREWEFMTVQGQDGGEGHWSSMTL